MGKYEKIKRLCKERGITITALERELGFARGSLSKIDKNQPGYDRIQKIADYFGKPIDFFMNDEVQKTGQNKEYYLDEATAEQVQKFFDSPDGKNLFDLWRRLEPEKFHAHVEYMTNLYRLEHPEEEDYY